MRQRDNALVFRTIQVVAHLYARDLQQAALERQRLLENPADSAAAHFLDLDRVDKRISIQNIDQANLAFGQVFTQAAGAADLAFVRSADYVDAARASGAGALIAAAGLDLGSRPLLRSDNPGLDFARAAQQLVAAPVGVAPGVHPSAVVDPGAVVHRSARIGPGVTVASGCRIGPGCVLHPGVVLYEDVTLGADCILHARCVLREGTVLGDRVRLQPSVVIGGEGFGYVTDGDGEWVQAPQLGRVVLEDDVEIGAGSTIDRGSLGETRIRRGVKIDNLVMVGHNCDIGENAILVSQTGIAGSSVLEAGVIAMAQSGVAGHLRIGQGAFLAARAGVHKDVPAGARVFGYPHLEAGIYHKSMAALPRLPDALRRLRALERRQEAASAGPKATAPARSGGAPPSDEGSGDDG